MTTTPRPTKTATKPSNDHPKAESKKRPPRPPIELPRDVDELLALDRPALERVIWEAQLQMGKAKRRRGELIAQVDIASREAGLIRVKGDIAFLGAFIHAAFERRARMRCRLRHELGNVPERAEAIAVAVDNVLGGNIWKLVQKEADRIQETAAKDLAKDPEAGPASA